MPDGVNYAKSLVPTMSTMMGAEWNGKVRATYDEYSVPSGTAINTTINVGMIKAGEVYVGGFVSPAASLGTGVTCNLGDTEQPARYLYGGALGGTAVQVAARAIGMGYKPTVDTPVYLTITGAITATTNTVKVVMLKACSN